MRLWQGKSISPGYAQGRAVVYRSRAVEPSRRRIAADQVDEEIRQLREALAAAVGGLTALKQRVTDEIGDEPAAIFTSHLAFLEDRAFAEKVEDRIARDLINAERALELEIDELARRLAAVEDPYFRERADDVRDLGRRVMAHLQGATGPTLPNLPENSILVADELLPSDTVNIDRTHVKGIVTDRCGRTSHAAILAKALGIPAVSDLKGVAGAIPPGAAVLVDGVNGTVTVSPSRSGRTRFTEQRDAYETAMSSVLAQEQESCVTRDGVGVTLLANLGRAGEADQVRAHHLDGVGLFRTEVLFLDSPAPPSFEVHRDIYTRVAEALQGLPLVIRTLDLGGDKHPAFLPGPSAHNPTLGLRGLRFSLKERSLLETQLAALADVAQRHPVHVLFPMVLGGDDLDAAAEMLQQVARDRGLATIPPVGAMIETPAALFALDHIVRRARFLSIGTNDLTQFMLAADRDAAELIDDYSVLHPPVLRAIRTVVSKASEAGLPLSVCGEAAGDPQLAPVLVGLGVRQLSMSPARSPAIRVALRRTSAAEAAALVEELVACRSLGEVKDRLAAASLATAEPSSSAATKG